ncbi:MAG: T9SS type A sorting domain-containing protein [Bacteroidota bacterium]
MNKTLYIITFVISSLELAAQNLVSNPSFEIYTSCPTGINQINLATPWVDPTSSQAECFNECSPVGSNVNVPFNTSGGYQYAKNGKGYAGINTYVKSFPIRIYIQSVLIDTLIAGETYCVSFYVNCLNIVNYAIDAIGAYISKTAITCGSGGCLLNFTPQVSNPVGNVITDTANWTEISGYFIATGGEKYITIGNFKNDANTDTVRINNISGRDESYYYIDSVTLMLCSDTAISVNELSDENFKINLYPNPSNGNVLLKYTIKQNGILNIYDVTGKQIEEHELSANGNELKLTNNLNSGIYLYQVIVNDKIVKSDKLVVIK